MKITTTDAPEIAVSGGGGTDEKMMMMSRLRVALEQDRRVPPIIVPSVVKSPSTTTKTSPLNQALMARRRPTSSDAQLIRSRLLNKLGISPPPAASDAPPSPPGNASYQQPKITRRENFVEPLKADHGKPEGSFTKRTPSAGSLSYYSSFLSPLSSLSSTASSSSPVGSSFGGRNPPSKSSRGVTFDHEVHVHSIPSRTAYSDRIRGHLWTPPLELQENAARNYLEFAAENWDWRNVATDADMVILENGERVHPVHFMGNNNDDYGPTGMMAPTGSMRM